MNSIDLYRLTRVSDIDLFANFEKILSARQKEKAVKPHEKECLTTFVEMLNEKGISGEGLKHFYYSYDIPQIGTEFDLLRINDLGVLNIELKSQEVGIERMQKQLSKNMYYLSHITREITLLTFVSSSKKFYQYDSNGLIQECDISTIISIIEKQSNCFDNDIDNLFKVSDFLVSPLNTPEKFIRKQYFLTPQQQEIKAKITQRIEKPNNNFLFCGITGGPGTGKTLALYDLAYHYSAVDSVCIIHCGILTAGHKSVSRRLSNLDIYPARDFDYIDFSNYKYVFIDESHRFYKNQFDILIEKVCANNLICVFAYDKQQVLSKAEIKRDLVQEIGVLQGFEEYKLSNKIRTNKEMLSFIKRLFNAKDPDIQLGYPSISAIYANDIDEAKRFIREFQRNDYTFISYTASRFKPGSFDEFYAVDNTHTVIGQEFDNILMLIDHTFSYNTNGQLQARTHPNPDYLYTRLLFQGLTRVREKMAIIVIDNEEVFARILSILSSTP